MKRLENMAPAQQRQLALALLALAVLLLASVTVLPLTLANKGYNDEIETLHERLLKLESIAAQDVSLRERYAQLRRTQATRGYFLQGDSEAVASADLQRLLKEITTRNEAQLMSTQILPATKDGSLTQVALRVRMRGPLPGLIQSLYEVEANPVLMFLDNVSLRTAVSIRQRLRAQNTVNVPFEATFDLAAYVTETQ